MSNIHNNFNKGKKGQITLFILIGLVLLALVLFGLFFIRKAQESQTDLGEPNEVPVEFVPVEQYVEQCLFDISKEAFVDLGENGGYINPQKYFSKGFSPTESDVLEFAPGSSIWMPYWWHLKSANTCKENCMFESNMPTIDGIMQGGDSSNSPLMDYSVEGMVSEYIEQNLDKCLNDFNGLTGYVISTEDEKRITTTITEQDVIIDLDYLLNVKGSESEGEIDRFRVHLPLNFRRIYSMAFNITKAEQEINFLDYHVITLIDLFSGIDSKKLPPLTGTSFEKGGQTYWFEGEVNDKITEMLTSYVPALQVLDSKNYDPLRYESIEDPMVKGIYKNMVIPIGKSYRSIEADLTYLSLWPIYLHVTPNEGGILSPQTFFNILPIGLQRYRFAYDVSYPVMVTLKDTSAFYGDGYTLMFALESNLRNNDVINSSNVQLEMPRVQSTGSLVCNINQRNSGDITVNVIDGILGEPIENAAIVFSLGSEGCMIGSTDVNGSFTGKFPQGLGALQISKNEYLTSSQFYGVSKDDDEVDIVLESFRTKQVRIVRKTVEKIDGTWTYKGNEKELDKNEQAVLLLERIKKDVYDTEYSVPVKVNLQGGEVRLIPGEYKINGQVILNEEIIIPKDKRKTCSVDVPIIGCIKHDEYTIPKQTLDQTVSGGINFNSTLPNRNWVITASDLDNSNGILIYVLSVSLKDVSKEDRIIEDMNQMANFFDYTSANRDDLEPVFS